MSKHAYVLSFTRCLIIRPLKWLAITLSPGRDRPQCITAHFCLCKLMSLGVITGEEEGGAAIICRRWLFR